MKRQVLSENAHPMIRFLSDISQHTPSLVHTLLAQRCEYGVVEVIDLVGDSEPALKASVEEFVAQHGTVYMFWVKRKSSPKFIEVYASCRYLEGAYGLGWELE